MTTKGRSALGILAIISGTIGIFLMNTGSELAGVFFGLQTIFTITAVFN